MDYWRAGQDTAASGVASVARRGGSRRYLMVERELPRQLIVRDRSNDSVGSVSSLAMYVLMHIWTAGIGEHAYDRKVLAAHLVSAANGVCAYAASPA